MISFSSRPIASLKALATAFLPKTTIEQVSKYTSQRQVSHDNDNDKNAGLISYCNYDLASPESQYIEKLAMTIQTKLDKFDRLKIITILYLLSNPIGTFLLFANIWLITKPFTKWDQQDRIRGLQNLRDSNLLIKRTIFSGIKRLLCGLAFSFTIEESKDSTPALVPDELNPFWRAVQYPGPVHRQLSPEQDERLRNDAGHDVLYRNGEKNPKVFIDPSKVMHSEYDVVIIGTGAGGSVAAMNFASAGHSVLMIEKGAYIPPDQISNIEVEAMDTMYEKHGLMTTEDGNLMILAGSTLGGGTSINWGCCIDTPHFVREEWCNSFGLEQFRSTSASTPLAEVNEFDSSLRIIKDRIGCDDSISASRSVSTRNDDAIAKGGVPPHNAANTLFWNACQKMEYKVEETGCNMKHPGDDTAGYSPLGDRYGNKQSGTVTFISDAIKTGNLNVLEQCTVHRVLMEKSIDGKRKAVGVEVKTVTGTKSFQIKARKCVICSAGSLHTPCILLRSKLNNKHIGRHLHLHPVVSVVGMYYGVKESKGDVALQQLPAPVRPSKGKGLVQICLRAPMTVVCKEFEKVYNGYGCKLEVPSLHLGLAAAGLPWLDPSDFKSKLAKYSSTLALVVLQRDHGEGTVTLNCQGSPSISYSLSDQDKESMMQGMHGGLKLLLSAGCDVISSGHNNDYGLELEHEQVEVKESKDLLKKDKVKSYLHEVQERGIEKHRIGVFSAHQMGSCRMGIDQKESAIDPNGQTWECDNLYVMDASAFPSASGANPMLTTYTISHMLSARLVKKLAKETGA